MALTNTHVVSANLIVARTKSSPGEKYFDKGAVLSEDVSADEKKRLVGLGLVKIVKVETTAGETQLTAAQKKAKADAEAAEKAAADAAAKAQAEEEQRKAAEAK